MVKFHSTEYHGKSALELCGIINDLTGSDFTPDTSFLPGTLGDRLSRIHWLSHELECRLDGHGGRQYATGPLLIELPPELGHTDG